jgi:hypothetical protein
MANKLSKIDVVRRWHSLFKGTYLSQCYEAGTPLLAAQREVVEKDIEVWRERLSSLSWFMKVVNECIALRANLEDKCTRHFSVYPKGTYNAPCVTLPPASLQSWESRFKSQALLDERALLDCMAYVDLNPIRANMADSPETSDHTCVKSRIESLESNTQLKRSIEYFVGSNQNAQGLSFVLRDYLELVDWTGRIIRKDKAGAITQTLPPILKWRLALNQKAWEQLITQFERYFGNWVGSEPMVRQVYSDKHYQRIPSTDHHRRLIG